MSAVSDGRVIIEAILDTANVSKNVGKLGKELSGISWKNIKEGDDKAKALSGAFKDAGTACTMSLTTPIAAAGAAAFGVASNYEQATSRIQAAFGGTREEAEKLSQVGKDVYEDGWGASLDEVNDALIQCKSTLRDVSDEDLQTVTTNAMMLSDTFDADVNESIRGTNALMEGFGLSATEASDLLTAGMQRGLNYTDELGDNLSEYSVRWGEAGMSASDYFSLLETGTSNGAYNLDKVGDYLNEFLTSLTDGRMEDAMGSFSAGTQDMFEQYKTGGATAQDMLNAVLTDIQAMPIEYDRAAAASTLWSSLGEDNAMGMILSLGNVQDSFGDVAGAAQEAADAASDSFGTKMQTAMRELQGAIEPLGEPLLNIATKVADVVKGFGEWFAGIGEGGQTAVLAIAGILAAIGPVLSAVGAIIPIVSTIVEVVTLCGGAMGVLSGVMTALMSPVTLVVAGIAALVAVLVYLWNTNEGFREAVINAWNAIMTAIQEIMAVLMPFLQAAWDTIVAIVVPLVQGIADAVGIAFTTILNVVSAIMGAVSGVISGVMQVIQGIFQTVVGFIVGLVTGDFSMMSDGVSSILNGLASIVSSIWNGIMDAVGAVVSGIGDLIANGWNTVCDVTSSLFGNAASIIGNIMGDAKNVVSGALDSIAGFFRGLKIEWPHIPLPHFEISGSFNLDPANFSVPTLGISWYAKGGVFNGPSVIGVGEAGPEAVVPLSGQRMQPFADAVAKSIGSDTSGNLTKQDVLEAIVEALKTVRMSMYLNGKTLVGELAFDMSVAMARLESDRSL